MVSCSVFIIPNDNSSGANATIFVHRDFLRVTPFTTDTTPLNYNAIIPNRTSINSVNSTIIITQQTLNGTKN